MKDIPRLVSVAALASAVLLFGVPLVAQVPKTPTGDQAGSTSSNAPSEVTLASVEALLATMDANTAIDDATKTLLRPKYNQAIEALKEAADNAARAENYRNAIKTAPQESAQLRAQLKTLPSAKLAAQVAFEGNTEDLQKDVDSRQATQSGLNDDLSNVTTELNQVMGRPVEISARLPDAQRELSDIRKQLASPEFAIDTTSPGRVADRILRQANQSKVLNELEMLNQEQLSQSVRKDLLLARQELLTRQVENAAAALKTLSALLQLRLESESERFSSLADKLQSVPEGDKAAKVLATEVQALANEFKEVVEHLSKAKPQQDSVRARLHGLIVEYNSIQQQLNLGSSGGVMAQILFDLQHRVHNAPTHVVTVELPTLTQTYLARLEAKDKSDRQRAVEGKFADRSSETVARLVTTRRDVLRALQEQYGYLLQALSAIEVDKRQYMAMAKEIDGYIREQLLWIRSSSPISVETLTAIPDAVKWAFDRDHWVDLRRGLRETSRPASALGMAMVLMALALLLLRGRIGAALERLEVKVRRISTDRYAHTGYALLWTGLLAAPIPLLIGSAGLVFADTPRPSAWLLDVAFGLRIAARITLVTGFLVVAFRPGGLCAVHFRWKKETLAQLRRATIRLAAIGIPALAMTLSYHDFKASSLYFDSVGRVLFMLAQAWTLVVLWQLFQSPDGVLATLILEHPTRLFTRWRYLWFPLLLACPLGLIVLAGLGYQITGLELSLGLIATGTMIAGGVFLHGLAMRWFMIKWRRLALAEALEKRHAQQEEVASQEQQEPSGEIVSIDPEDDEQLDLDSINEQTRALLRLLFGLSVAVAIIVFWSNTIPLIAVSRAIPIPLAGGLTLLGLAQASLIVVVTVIAAKNLPGLLELAVLRATAIEPGTRHAIATLCQYAVIALGIFLFVNVLDLDWANLGWMAAALSVGLGFGLQEVVANFVCGLILLFERPIRVGDVVTVESITGTVTKIQMRATTIVNWDRQEFVVPNKMLITNPLLNWTLSAPLNRVIIPVGVAYGSDTEKARQILLDVAADHPVVLDDPAPLATFEQFADSSLNLVLRAYLPNLENRIGTITELHTEINQRFAVAGIEIAFPQQDLHIRSGWDGVRGANPDAP